MKISIPRSRDLMGRALSAKAEIERLFTFTAIPVGINFGWGQFLDELRDVNDYGIYGTSAGAQVLLSSKDTQMGVKASGSLKVLGEAFQPNSLFYNKGDTTIIYKVISLADSFLDASQQSTRCIAVNVLCERQLPKQGWGEYYINDAMRDLEPKVIATSLALITLCNDKQYCETSNCNDAVLWLCDYILSGKRMRPFEIGLAYNALIDLGKTKTRFNHDEQERYEKSINLCANRLFTWARSRKKSDFELAEFYGYSTLISNYHRNQYLFFLPDCLAAIGFIKNGNTNMCNYIRRVIEFYTIEIIERKGFRPSTTDRISVVDHLWIHRLLRVYIQNIETLNCSNTTKPYLRVLLMVILGLTGLTLGWLSISLSTADVWIRAILVFFGAVSVGLFVKMIRVK